MNNTNASYLKLVSALNANEFKFNPGNAQESDSYVKTLPSDGEDIVFIVTIGKYDRVTIQESHKSVFETITNYSSNTIDGLTYEQTYDYLYHALGSTFIEPVVRDNKEVLGDSEIDHEIGTDKDFSFGDFLDDLQTLINKYKPYAD